MATTPRLTFLYPAFFRSAFSHSSPSCRVPSKFRSLQQSGYKTTCRKQQEEVRSRYGTANEPPPHLAANDRPAQKKASRASKASKSEIGASYTPEDRALPKPEDKAAGEKKKGKDVDSSADHSALEKSTIDSSLETLPTKETSEVLREGSESPTHVEQPATAIKPLEKMLDIEPSPSSSSSSSSSTQEQEEGKSSHTHRPPHLVTPPYVHHFDTYTLVRNLENSGGFSQDQAVTCMKAVRSLLSTNMDLARAGLVSKSDVENESYLFKAACSELKTEIQNKRRQEVETMRTERTQLQHEFDILNQRVGQETAGLKDELKGMFDDRKMGVRMEQKAMESTIQQLNYKITVALNSDSRSEVEGLRWILTRRAGMAIVISAVMMLGGASYISRLEAEEKERKKSKKNDGGEFKTGGEVKDESVSPQSADTSGDALATLSTKEGLSPGYVSLG